MIYRNFFTKSASTNILVMLVTFFSLYISYLITSNSFRDNINYNTAYLLFNNYSFPNIKDNMFLINKNNDKQKKIQTYCIIHSKHLLDENEYISLDNKYSLIKEEICNQEKYKSIKNIKKKYYLSSEITIKELYKNYLYTTGSLEIVNISLNFISSKILNYDRYILFINTIFLVSFFLLLKKFTSYYKLIYITIVLTDFYFYVYLSELHRLKLAILFLFLYFIIDSKSKYLFILLSILSHFQSILFYVYLFIIDGLKTLTKRNLLSKTKKYLVFFVISFFILIIFQDYILSKLNHYKTFELPLKGITLILLYCIFLYTFKFKDTLFLFLPLALVVLIASFIVGEFRLLFILMEFILLFELNRFFDKKNISLIIIIPILLYNSYKSIDYIMLGLS